MLVAYLTLKLIIATFKKLYLRTYMSSIDIKHACGTHELL
jgi:hypothetical protein